MADALINLLQSRTVLIRAGDALGTGTFIAPGMVLTCAHVVRKAHAENANIEILLPDRTEPGEFIWTKPAKEVYLSKRYEEQGGARQQQRTTEYPDVAVLEIVKTDHAIMAFPKFETNAFDLTDMQFLAFGFQKKDRDLQHNVPQAVSLNYSGEQVDGVIRKLMFTNGLIRPGMSGASLIERESGQIVGIVHMTMSPNDDLGAYVIPVETIWKEIQKWEEDGDNKLFSKLNSKTHTEEVKKQYRQEYPLFPLLRKYGWRLVALPIIMFFGIWWFFYHNGPIKEASIVAGILVALSISGKLIGDWLGDKMNSETSGIKAFIGKFFFSNLFLTSFALFIACLWTFTTSVWIYGNPDEEGAIPITYFSDVEMTTSTQKNLDPTGLTRFLMLTPPLGHSIALQPKDREEVIIDVKPFERQELYFPSSFRLAPTFVLRFEPRYPLKNKMNNYKIKVQVKRIINGTLDSLPPVEDLPNADTGSLIFGRQADLDKRMKHWENELRTNYPTMEDSQIDEILLKWKNTETNMDLEFEMDDIIKVEIYDRVTDSLYNEETYRIRDDMTDKLIKIKMKNKKKQPIQ